MDHINERRDRRGQRTNSWAQRMPAGIVCVLLGALLAVPAVSAADTRTKARQLTLREADFEQASVQQVVTWLRQRARALDPERVGVNIFVKPSGGEKSRVKTAEVSLKVRDVTVAQFVRYLCLSAGLKYRIDSGAIVIADPSVPLQKLETRVYRVKPGVLKHKPTRRINDPFGKKK